MEEIKVEDKETVFTKESKEERKITMKNVFILLLILINIFSWYINFRIGQDLLVVNDKANWSINILKNAIEQSKAQQTK